MPNINETTDYKTQITPYHAKYFAYELTRRYSSDSLQKLAASLSNAQVVEETVSEDFEIFDEMKDEWTEDDEETEETKTYTPEEIKSIKEESKSLKEFYALAKSIKKNSKGEVLLTALKAGFAEAEKRGGVKKAVIFTESTRTQKYLENILENTEYSGKIVLFNGSNTDPKSQQIYKQWIEKHQGTDRISECRFC